MISELEHRSVLSLRLSYSNFFPRLTRVFASPFSNRIPLSILSNCPAHSAQWLCARGSAWNPTSMLAGSQVCLLMQLTPVPKPWSSLGTVRIGHSLVWIRTILAVLIKQGTAHTRAAFYTVPSPASPLALVPHCLSPFEPCCSCIFFYSSPMLERQNVVVGFTLFTFLALCSFVGPAAQLLNKSHLDSYSFL